jgi:cellulose synthase/poly-beta-1,6-N-acetylglucosamine synthase-like glycosyltransferase
MSFEPAIVVSSLAQAAPAVGLADWLHAPAVRWPLTAIYLAVLAVVSVYGLHRYWLVILLRRTRGRAAPLAPNRFGELPGVTVQLPLFNESAVAERVIDAACRLDYPRDRLHVQVLDDSTDGCAAIARRRVEYWRSRGVDIEYRRRPTRNGYKAGALADALPHAKGRFIAVFDADFVPPRTFLLDTIDHFTDPRVGMVQARWGHLNRDDSLLTRCQGVFLDAHFLIEHAARARAGRWFNFNGTAGVWRRQAIDQAGGWQGDTLTEDVDLSYRAQLAGWRFFYRPDVVCPAELPPTMSAFKSQQHRWAKGSMQSAIKLLPRLMRSDAPRGAKLEAFFHLTGPIVYPCVTLMALLFFPAIYVNLQPIGGGAAGAVVGLTLFALGSVSAGVFYAAAQRLAGRSWPATLASLPALIAVGIGVAANNARGVVEALVGRRSPFVRTPKFNTHRGGPNNDTPPPRTGVAMSLAELSLGTYVLACAALTATARAPAPAAAPGWWWWWLTLPFLLLFAAGYFYVGIGTLMELRRGRDVRPRSEVAHAVH